MATFASMLSEIYTLTKRNVGSYWIIPDATSTRIIGVGYAYEFHGHYMCTYVFCLEVVLQDDYTSSCGKLFNKSLSLLLSTCALILGLPKSNPSTGVARSHAGLASSATVCRALILLNNVDHHC